MLSAADSTGKVISYEYDLLGNKTKMISPEGKSLTYTYDTANRLTSIINGGTFTFGYDTRGQKNQPHLSQRRHGNLWLRQTGKTHEPRAQERSGNSYQQQQLHPGQDRQPADQHHPGPDQQLQYDAIYRLTQALTNTPGYSTNTKATKGTTNAVQQQKDYFTYDPVGNRLTSANNRSYTYGPANQLVSENGTTYSYDKNGNLTQKVTADGNDNLHLGLSRIG